MSTKDSGFTLTGDVLSITHMQRDHSVTNERTNEVQGPYNYHRLRLLVGDEVLDVKAEHIGESQYGPRPTWEGDLPSVGQTVTLDVEVGAYKDRTSGRALITVRGLRVAGPKPAAVPRAS